ncbi:hypothetical protein [Castellaniella sp.]|uniref:hypothetical protein n=1 Tax=Castellaniella sp. TaxID=1955812 RepID=UPI002AFF317E|nr:hypothetical protein [Castellaniella sp.]
MGTVTTYTINELGKEAIKAFIAEHHELGDDGIADALIATVVTRAEDLLSIGYAYPIILESGETKTGRGVDMPLSREHYDIKTEEVPKVDIMGFPITDAHHPSIETEPRATMNITQAFVNPADLLSALRRMDQEGEPYQFVGSAPPHGSSKPSVALSVTKPAYLTLWIDGAETQHTVTLNDDGTYQVYTAVEL